MGTNRIRKTEAFVSLSRQSRLALRGEHHALAVYVALLDRVRGLEGEAFPSYDKLADDSGVSRREVARALTKLEQLGLLTRERRESAAGRGSNLYTLFHTPAQVPPGHLPQVPGGPLPQCHTGPNPSAGVALEEKQVEEEPSEEEQNTYSAPSFEQFWEAYPKRNGQTRGPKQPALDKWVRMSSVDRALAFTACPIYAEAIDLGYYKDAVRFLTHRIFDDYQHPAAKPKTAAERFIEKVHAEEAAKANPAVAEIEEW